MPTIMCQGDTAIQGVLHPTLSAEYWQELQQQHQRKQFATPQIHVLLSTGACIPAPTCQPSPKHQQASVFRLHQLVCMPDRSDHR